MSRIQGEIVMVQAQVPPPSRALKRPTLLAPQPGVGLAGLILVAVTLAVLAVVQGPQNSLLVLGPISTFWLPVLAASALWWGLARRRSEPIRGRAA
jgi:hypothetical protein